VRPSLRFLAVAVVGWAGFRAASLGVLPGAGLFSIERSEAKAPPIVPTQFPSIEPLPPTAPTVPAAYDSMSPPMTPADGSAAARYVQGIVGVPVAMRPGTVTVYQLPPPSPAREPQLPPPLRLASATMPEHSDYAPLPPLGAWPAAGFVGISRPPMQSTPATPEAPLQPRLDRLQLTSWALLRSQQAGIAGSRSLASGGQLGASQAGLRVTYNIDRLLALTGRLSSEVGRRGGEVAGGIRVHPLASIPVWLTAERRQMIGSDGGGRNAFAFFAEAGLYQRPLPWSFSLDAYLQGGVVGLRSRDLFVDGGAWVSRPVYRNFSAGFGVWGGAQPGLYRVDAGPRVTMRVRKNLKVHVDWRQRLAGNARPGSGPALTLAGDF